MRSLPIASPLRGILDNADLQTLTPLIPYGVFAFVLLIFVALVAALLKPRQPDFPYAKVDSVLTPAERKFCLVLLDAVGADYFPCTKMRIADMLRVTVKGKGYMSAFNRIAMKHIDFLLCDNETGEPLLAIELDDSSHRRIQKRIERDAFVDQALQVAGLPLLRVPVAKSYEVSELRRLIRETLR